jgi:hypothetical protein
MIVLCEDRFQHNSWAVPPLTLKVNNVVQLNCTSVLGEPSILYITYYQALPWDKKEREFGRRIKLRTSLQIRREVSI